MKQLFPAEIQENSIQSHWVKRNKKSRAIYLVAILTLTVTIVSLPFIYIDVSTQSRSIVRSPHENNILQSVVSGEIREVYLFENKAVQRGDTLLVISTDEADEQAGRREQKLIENRAFINDINLLLHEREGVITPKYKAEQSQYLAKLDELQVSVDQLQEEFQVSQRLYEKNAESKYENQQKASQLKSALSQLSLHKQQQFSSWQSEKVRLEYENRDYESELLQLEKKKKQYIITAPISGNIVQYIGLQPGNFLSAGQQIAYISSGDNLIMECYVSPSDIGYIYVGQEVKFQMDTYEYQQWGLLEGKVHEIISDVTQTENASFFRVRCTMNKAFLQLSSGYTGEVKKGMSATARFFLTRRSLAQLLFDKIDQWMNPKRMTDGN